MEAQQLTLFDETVIDAGCDCRIPCRDLVMEKAKI